MSNSEGSTVGLATSGDIDDLIAVISSMSLTTADATSLITTVQRRVRNSATAETSVDGSVAAVAPVDSSARRASEDSAPTHSGSSSSGQRTHSRSSSIVSASSSRRSVSTLTSRGGSIHGNPLSRGNSWTLVESPPHTLLFPRSDLLHAGTQTHRTPPRSSRVYASTTSNRSPAPADSATSRSLPANRQTATAAWVNATVSAATQVTQDITPTTDTEPALTECQPIEDPDDTIYTRTFRGVTYRVPHPEAKAPFYWVSVGHEIGVFAGWNITSPLVLGVSRATYGGCASVEEGIRNLERAIASSVARVV